MIRTVSRLRRAGNGSWGINTWLCEPRGGVMGLGSGKKKGCGSIIPDPHRMMMMMTSSGELQHARHFFGIKAKVKKPAGVAEGEEGKGEGQVAGSAPAGGGGAVGTSTEMKASSQNGLHKVYNERRILYFSPEQVFDVVSNVENYKCFVPWCKKSEILERISDSEFRARLHVGFKLLSESYDSFVRVKRPDAVEVNSDSSHMFKHLTNSWKLSPGPFENSTIVEFNVSFEFASVLHSKIANIFFDEVVKLNVLAFEKRCKKVYGSGGR